MSRTGKIKRRMINKDSIYDNVLVHKLVNKIMKSGKKQLAQKIVYSAFEKLEKETDKNPLQVFEDALKNCRPQMEVRPRRVGGATYMVPLEVRGERRNHLALLYIIESAQKRPSSEHVKRHSIIMSSKLAAELEDASRGEGGAVKKREEIEKMAAANRAFAHFRW